MLKTEPNMHSKVVLGSCKNQANREKNNYKQIHQGKTLALQKANPKINPREIEKKRRFRVKEIFTLGALGFGWFGECSESRIWFDHSLLCHLQNPWPPRLGLRIFTTCMQQERNQNIDLERNKVTCTNLSKTKQEGIRILPWGFAETLVSDPFKTVAIPPQKSLERL